MAPAAPLHAQDSAVAQAVKATYLYKLLPFVTWPGTPDRFTLCVVGDDPFGTILDRAVSGQSAIGRPIELRRMPQLAPDAPCQLVFAAGSAAQPVPAILAALRGRPILTVTDAARLPDEKGIVNFLIVENRVRFEIDDRLAAQAGLAISSKLLAVAVAAQPRGPQRSP